MSFKKGDPKPANSGRKKGAKNKRKILKISDFILSQNINIAQELYLAIQSIPDPIAKAKALMEFYKFVDAPVKEKEAEGETQDQPTDLPPSDILTLVGEKQ